MFGNHTDSFNGTKKSLGTTLSRNKNKNLTKEMKSPHLAFPKNAISILDLAEFGFCELTIPIGFHV